MYTTLYLENMELITKIDHGRDSVGKGTVRARGWVLESCNVTDLSRQRQVVTVPSTNILQQV